MRRFLASVVAVVVLLLVAVPAPASFARAPQSARVTTQPTVVDSPLAESTAKTGGPRTGGGRGTGGGRTTGGTTSVGGTGTGTDICKVTSATNLGEGGDEDWSAATNLLTFDRHDARGINQIYVSQADGTHTRCLTCTQKPGAPRPDRNKFNPSWDPSGRYIVLQVEMDTSWVTGSDTNPMTQELMLNGLWTDLYVTTADGSQWTKLTNTTLSQADGVMNPAFSPDGSKLLWSRLVASASSTAPWGVYRLMLANFSVASGTPTISDVRDITPPGMQFVEAHVFSPDGRTVLVTSNLDTTTSKQMNIFRIDLASGIATNLTPGSTMWNEHAIFSRGGAHVVYMTGIPWHLLTTDLVMVNAADGSDWTQLTHFNDWGYPEYAGQGVYTIRPRFSGDGHQLAVTAQSIANYPARTLWVLTFAGACGAA